MSSGSSPSFSMADYNNETCSRDTATEEEDGNEALPTSISSGHEHLIGLPLDRHTQPLRFSTLLCQRLKDNWKVLLLGQILSLLLASAGAAQATLHLRCGLSAPTFTMALVYLGLFVLHLPILVVRFLRKNHVRVPMLEDGCDSDIGHTNEPSSSSSSHPPLLRRSLWWYLLLAFCDVQANAITMLAFRYTTLTSVTLFDALAIPASMVISRCIFFRSTRRYRPLHYVGVIVCMIGVVLNVLQDYESDTASSSETMKAEAYPHKLKGDICAITGGILYGLNDVLTEVTVSGDSGDPSEYLGLLGFFGAAISLIQSMVLERSEIRAFFPSDDSTATCSTPKGLAVLASFVGVTMLSYIGGSRFLMISEATFFNLSLLTGDLWSVVFSVVAEKIVPRPLFFAALVAVLSGVIVYEMAPSPALEKNPQQQPQQLQDGGDENLEIHNSGDGIVKIDNNDCEGSPDEEIEMNDFVVIT